MRRFALSSLLVLVLSLSFATASEAAPQTRIVGGSEAAAGAWPSLATVYSQIGSNTYLCGGTVVSSRWILTASHCADGVAANKFFVVLGSNDRTSGSVVSDAVHMHPAYDSSTFANDLALVRLSSATSQPPVQIAKPSESSLFATGDAAYIAGWGTTCFENAACPIQQMLREATIHISNYSTCATNYASQGIVLPANTICAGDTGKDTCQGDSGGPLMVDSAPGASPARLQVGIVSNGIGCAEPDYPGIYADASAYRSWIGSYVVESLAGPSSAAWGSVRKNRSVSKTLTFTNSSTLPVSVSSSKSGSARFSITNNTCSGVLEGEQSCSVVVSFRPTTLRAQSGKITVLGGVQSSPLKAVVLSGRGR